MFTVFLTNGIFSAMAVIERITTDNTICWL